MDVCDLDIRDAARPAAGGVGRLGRVVVALMTVLGVVACGGASAPKSAQVVVSIPSQAATTASSSTAPHRAVRPTPPRRRTKSSTITIAANALAPAYKGVSPITCLRAVGLNRARPSREVGAWLANAGATPETDSNAVVFLSGPYKNHAAATRYARSLHVVELAASGGRWVASAALRSHLQIQVDNAALCMAQAKP